MEMRRWKQRFPNFNLEALKNTSLKMLAVCFEEVFFEEVPYIILETGHVLPDTPQNIPSLALQFSSQVLGLDKPSIEFAFLQCAITISTENEAGFYIRRVMIYINYYPKFTSYMEITPATVVWYNKRE